MNSCTEIIICLLILEISPASKSVVVVVSLSLISISQVFAKVVVFNSPYCMRLVAAPYSNCLVGVTTAARFLPNAALRLILDICLPRSQF